MYQQITIKDFLTVSEELNIYGLCDDAYCPNCNHWIDDLKFKDCSNCPFCGKKISWKRWHTMND